jgi:hypothetical protein
MITGINNKTFLTTLSHLASSVGNSSPTVKSNGTALPAAASASAKVILAVRRQKLPPCTPCRQPKSAMLRKHQRKRIVRFRA